MKPGSDSKITLAVSCVADGNLSLRWGDEQAVLRARETFLEKNDLQPKQCAVMEVEHKDAVVTVTKSDLSDDPTATVTAEALITNERNLALFLLTADCLPIALYDPVQNVIGLAHLGWRPTGMFLIQKVIKKMGEEFNSQTSDLLVYIGPYIHKESYKLDTHSTTNIWPALLRVRWS